LPTGAGYELSGLTAFLRSLVSRRTRSSTRSSSLLKSYGRLDMSYKATTKPFDLIGEGLLFEKSGGDRV
jgi:hypothetical protein